MKKIGFLLLVVVLTVGALGVGYAAWRDTITIDGTVSTGEVCVEFTGGYFSDSSYPLSYVPTSYGGVVPYGFMPHDTSAGLLTPDLAPPAQPDRTATDVLGFATNLDKNVAWGSVYVDPSATKTLHVALRNVYPWYYNHLNFTINNCGNVPVKLERIVITVPAVGGNPEMKYYLTRNDQVVQLDLDGNGTFDLETAWIELVANGVQLEGSWDVSMPFLVLQDEGSTIQGDEFEFDITFEWIQWNEYVAPD
jgi:hypothetical protein